MQQEETPTLPPLPWSQSTAPAVIDALVKSGLSVNKFADLHNVATHRVFYWRSKLAKEDGTTKARLLPVQTSSRRLDPHQNCSDTPTIEVKMTNGTVIFLRGLVSQTNLACLLQTCGDRP